MNKIFSVSVVADGIYGPSFTIGVTVRVDGHEMARFEGRIPDSAVKDSWVQENILPVLVGMPVTHFTSVELEGAFWAFWMTHKENAIVIAYRALAESDLFRRCIERDLEFRRLDSPYPAIHDVATLLLVLEEYPGSVDAYIKKNGSISVPFKGVSHNPVYGAISAAVAWEHARWRLAGRAYTL